MKVEKKTILVKETELREQLLKAVNQAYDPMELCTHFRIPIYLDDDGYVFAEESWYSDDAHQEGLIELLSARPWMLRKGATKKEIQNYANAMVDSVIRRIPKLTFNEVIIKLV